MHSQFPLDKRKSLFRMTALRLQPLLGFAHWSTSPLFFFPFSVSPFNKKIGRRVALGDCIDSTLRTLLVISNKVV